MSHIRLVCTECAAAHAADMRALACRKCAAPLDVAYDDPAAHAIPIRGAKMPVPIHADAMPVTMREGDTPVVPLPAVAAKLGLANVWGKLEFISPTASFKDRGTAMMLSVAAELGVSEIVEDSSGNAGASVAAYAARAGIRAHVFAPESAPPAKTAQIRVYGANAVSVPGPREASAQAADEYRRARGCVYASHNLSPYFIEGVKAFAYETATAAGLDIRHIVIPVGNGSLLLGAWKGWRELVAAGRARAVPKLHAVQADAVQPVVAEFEGREWTPSGAPAVATTVAGGISVASPPRKRQVARAVRESGGRAVAVEDCDTLRWRDFLAAKEGVFAEPTSAAAFAGLEKLVGAGDIADGEDVLMPITGFGLKDFG